MRFNYHEYTLDNIEPNGGECIIFNIACSIRDTTVLVLNMEMTQ